MHLRGTRDRIGVRISFVRVLAEENYKYNIGNPHRQHLQSFPDNQPCQWSIYLRDHSQLLRRALKSRAKTKRKHMRSSWYMQREALGMKKKSALKKQGGERLENFGSGKIIGVLLVQIWSLLRFSQTRAASFPVVLGDFGCGVTRQNTRTLKFKNGNTQKASKSSLCTDAPPPALPSGKIWEGIFPEKRGVCKKANRNPPITDHCFLRGPLRWLTAAKYANVSWPLNLRVRVFLKSAVKAAMFLSKLTGNEPFRLRIYLDTIKFVLPRVFTPKRRLAQKFVQNHGRRSKSAKSPLPVVVRRSKTSIFNVERWNKSVGFRPGYRFSSGQLCTKKSCMYIYRFFFCHICRTTVCWDPDYVTMTTWGNAFPLYNSTTKI